MSRVLAIALLCVFSLAVRVPAAEAQGPAPAAAVGTIAGTVLDKSTGDPLIDAGVEIVELKKTVRSDLDGKFAVKVAPGRYTVRFFAPLYQAARITNVVVVAGQSATADAALAPEGEGAGLVVEVTATADKAAEATQLVRRKKASVVSDTISAQAIEKSPDSDASEVVERVPSVVVDEEDDTVIVRGLGDRYSQALLNGSRLPSTDPNKRVVSLDLFPANFLESINVIKSYTPDLPGDFAGGLVDIELRNYPEQLQYSLGLSIRGNTATTFQDYNTYKGSPWDYLGFGNSFRELPDIFPADILDPKVPPTTAQQRAIGGSLKNIWNVTEKTAPPNWGANFSVGNSFDWWGFNLGGLYETKYQNYRTAVFNTYQNKNVAEDPVIEPRDQFTYDIGQFQARIGGLLTAGATINPENKINLRAFVNHQATNEAWTGQGQNESEGPQVELTQDQLIYEEENLGFGQLSGEHLLPWQEISVEWRTALSQTTQEVPDQRFVLLSQPEDAPKPALVQKQPSLLRVFSNLDEWLSDTSVDATLPFETGLPFTDVWSGMPAKAKFGLAYAYRDRDFDLRRFNYQFPSGEGGGFYDLTLSPEVLLRTQNLGASTNFFQFQELTQEADFFQASQEIAGVYGMVELPIVRDRLRFIGGLRGEYSYIRLRTSDRQSNPLQVNINDLNPIPGVNLVYTPVDDMNIRYAYSLNPSRPEFRELTPVQYVEPSGVRTTVGNPFLESFTISSQELRWEWFLSAADVVSLGFFYKQLSSPIEKVALSFSTIDVDSFKNANDATNYGFEVEMRRNLGALLPYMPDGSTKSALSTQLPFFTLFFNVNWTHSEVDVGQRFTPEECLQFPDPKPPDCTQVVTNTRRALQGAPPYVVNAGVEYDNDELFTSRLLYNTVGPTIDAAGLNGLPDIFEEPRNQVDFVAIKKIKISNLPLEVKFSAENILNARRLQTQDDRITIRYRQGVTFGLGVSYSF